MALPAVGRSGDDAYPRVQTVYQQLHNYPVGSSGGERAKTTFGNKYNITPVRRELLVRPPGRGRHGRQRRNWKPPSGAGSEASRHADRYGLPFLGDNSFLPDRIDESVTIRRRPTGSSA